MVGGGDDGGEGRKLVVAMHNNLVAAWRCSTICLHFVQEASNIKGHLKKGFF